MKKLLTAGLLIATAFAAEGYKVLNKIKIGGTGGWDYVALDNTNRRIYASHGPAVEVVDPDAGKVVGQITQLHGVHGIAVAPELNKGFISNGQSNSVTVFDLKTLAKLGEPATGQNPDAICYEPKTQRVFTFNGRSNDATAIDAKTNEIVATFPLNGKPEFCVVDGAGKLYNNLEDKSEVVVIDTKKHAVVNRWPIAPGEEPSGMAFDEQTHRLFLGCGGSKTMVMLDSTSGKVITSVPIGQGVDANAFDPGTRLAFASCGDGTVTIAHEDTPDKLTVVQTLETQRGSRTMTIDPKTHKIYLAAAKFEAPAEGQRRGKMVPGSFKILVYGMEKSSTK